MILKRSMQYTLTVNKGRANPEQWQIEKSLKLPHSQATANGVA